MKQYSKKQKKNIFSKHPLRSFAILVFILGLIYGGLVKMPSQSNPNVNIISSPLTYGEVTLSGILQKDAPLSAAGKYYLSISDGHTIQIMASNLDKYVNKQVEIAGNLSPATEDLNLPILSFTTIKVSN